MPAVEAIAITIMELRCLGPMKAPRAGMRGSVVWASRFRGPGMAFEECWGASLHQLVHNPKTGDATGLCSLAGRSFFFSRGKVTANHKGSLPLQVPSRECTGWFVPTFTPTWIPSLLRPLLFRPLIRVVWLFSWPLVCQLFLLLGLFAGIVVCKFLLHAVRGADLMQGRLLPANPPLLQ